MAADCEEERTGGNGRGSGIVGSALGHQALQRFADPLSEHGGQKRRRSHGGQRRIILKSTDLVEANSPLPISKK